MIVCDRSQSHSEAEACVRTEREDADRANGFDFLRFLLAALVILSHAPIIEGRLDAEPLVRLTGRAISLGELAVFGFFVISGYLVSRSWERSRSLGDYLQRRALRIYPGFIAASLLSVFVVGALAATNRAHYYTWPLVGRSLLCLLLCALPWTPPVFAGLPYPRVNGSLWTIQLEVVSYLLAAVLGLLGAYRRRFLLVGTAVAFLLLRLVRHHLLPTTGWFYVHDLDEYPLFAVFFFAGACFYAYRERVLYSRRLAFWAAALVLGSLFTGRLPLLILPTAGAYLLLYAAFRAPATLQRFGRYGDFSYGLYLYAWPVQMLLVWYSRRTINPWIEFVTAFFLSLLLAVVSWRLIEKPFLNLKKRRADR